ARNRPRRDGVHFKFVAAPFLGQRLTQSDHSPLRDCVRTSKRVTLVPGNGRDVDYLPMLPLGHLRQDSLCTEECAGEVYRQSAIPVLPADLIDRRCRADNPGVIDEHIDPAETLERFAYKRLNRGLISHL